jgi:hypothetical protein
MTNAVSWEGTGYIFPWTVVNLSKMIRREALQKISRAMIPLIKRILLD